MGGISLALVMLTAQPITAILITWALGTNEKARAHRHRSNHARTR